MQENKRNKETSLFKKPQGFRTVRIHFTAEAIEWLKELGRLAERVTDVLDKVRFSNRLPDGTRNGEDREDEP